MACQALWSRLQNVSCTHIQKSKNVIAHGKKKPQMEGVTCRHVTECLLGISAMDCFLHHRSNKNKHVVCVSRK